MNKKEKFAYDIDFGAIMDYVENRFMLVIKDEDWTQEEIDMLNSGIDLHFCYTNDIAVFVLEGGDIDSSDFISMFKSVIGKSICLKVIV